MELSYPFRLTCWALFMLGIVRVAFGLGSVAITRWLRPRIKAQTARGQETYYFVAALLPDATALMLALAVAAPAFHLKEANGDPERVGLLCVPVAFAAALHYTRVVVRGMRLARNMRLDSTTYPNGAGAPIDSIPAVLAVRGIVRTRIVASPMVVRGELFSPEARAIAIAHEESHLHHRDNLKLFLLSSLSNAGHSGRSVQRWRFAAERAADDDAVAGNKRHAILLAEALVQAARAVSQAAPPALAMELMPFEWELESRVDRLLNPPPRPQVTRPARLLLVASMLCLVQTALCLLMATSHEFAEFIFRLG